MFDCPYLLNSYTLNRIGDCYKFDTFSIFFAIYGLVIGFFVHRMQVLTPQVKKITAKLVQLIGLNFGDVSTIKYIAYLF